MTDAQDPQAPAKPRAARAPSADAARADLEAVEAYLAAVPPVQREALEQLRRQIRALVPAATEKISYGMPSFHLQGGLIGYAAFKDHLSLFPMGASVLDGLADEIAAHRGGKGTLHFTPEAPLPEALLERIVRARVAENEAKRGPGKRAKTAPAP